MEAHNLDSTIAEQLETVRDFISKRPNLNINVEPWELIADAVLQRLYLNELTKGSELRGMPTPERRKWLEDKIAGLETKYAKAEE